MKLGKSAKNKFVLCQIFRDNLILPLGVRKQLALPFESKLTPETKCSSSHGVVQILKFLNLLEHNFQ